MLLPALKPASSSAMISTCDFNLFSMNFSLWVGLLMRLIVPLHLLGPVLLECCRLQPTSLSSMIVLQPPLLCEGWGGRPLCLSGDCSVLTNLSWPCDCTAQSSISRSSVRHFPEQSWTIVTFPCLKMAKSFTSWYALLLLFFLRFSSVSLHCSPIQFSCAFSCIS